ncbi:MAG: apocytochrome f [Thermostichales cyanobacterium BF3_bins_165]
MKRLLCMLMMGLVLLAGTIRPAQAYPAYAQAAYDNPREATGKIVCANCHLAQMPTLVELPQAVTPGQVFDLKVKIPYDHSLQEVYSDGSRGGLGVGAVVVLPEGFRLATEAEMTEKQREETAETYISEYSEAKPNILVVGPIPGDEHPEILFPIKAPDPAQDPSVHFIKYSVHIGANRGRGQLNPDGSLSNNNQFRSPYAGLITEITTLDDPSTVSPDAPYAKLLSEESMPGTRIITVSTDSGSQYVAIPPGPELVVAVGSTVKVDSPLTNNPNVGGFGQVDREIVLQNPDRIKWLLAFLGAIFFAQLMLVLKKKQVEQLQAAEALGL